MFVDFLLLFCFVFVFCCCFLYINFFVFCCCSFADVIIVPRRVSSLDRATVDFFPVSRLTKDRKT